MNKKQVEFVMPSGNAGQWTEQDVKEFMDEFSEDDSLTGFLQE